MSTPTAERQIEWIIDHMESWENEPRKPGVSITEPKVCVIRITPYKVHPKCWLYRQFLRAVLNRCIAVEDGSPIPDVPDAASEAA